MKTALIGITLLALVGLLFLFGQGKSQESRPREANYTKAPTANVEFVDGVQVVNIRAKGGYSPRRSVAKAGLPTVFRFDSKGSFDCSVSVRIPSVGISRSLDFSGNTDIEVGSPAEGLMQGSCTMGMYGFEVDFIR